MDKRQLYIIVAVVAVAVFAMAAFLRIRSDMALKYQQTDIPKIVQQVPVVSETSIAPSIEDVQGRPSMEIKTPQKEPASLAQVYSQYSKEDAGGNMVESWAKVPQEEKEKVFEQLDQEIARSEEALKINPQDKTAKHTLFISGTLKKLCRANFNYDLLESVPEDQGGFKSKYKK